MSDNLYSKIITLFLNIRAISQTIYFVYQRLQKAKNLEEVKRIINHFGKITLTKTKTDIRKLYKEIF